MNVGNYEKTEPKLNIIEFFSTKVVKNPLIYIS